MNDVLDRWVHPLAENGTWRALSTLPEKFQHFATDSAFRESWRTAVEVLGADALPFFQRLAIITIKPDGVLSRKADACLDYLAAHDFVPVHAEMFWYDRPTARDLWRFQWNVATQDRIELTDLILYRTQAMTVFLMDVSDPLAIPAAPRLIRLKGSAFPEDRDPVQLREVLGAPNRVAVLVHCPDEPMDIVRELGVVFDRATLAEIYATLATAFRSPAPQDMTVPVEKLYTGTPQVSLDVDRAVAGLFDRLRGEAGPGGRAAAALLRARQGVPLEWRSWAADVAAAGLSPTDWETVLIASQYIQHDLPGSKTLIRETGRRRWLAGEGLMRAPGA
ncbi:hypothetical protein MF672_008060 [Actinomadura sp. ATCC 31491]|uniref:Nucleoside diphosphate kinase-like domain-containing protein n=1 Tax=Actinomadura luzonensis TaxID=2805427 RepID=A0ABT0FN19_9ACTN|nr:nucleoside-diphosphate kinase [Actinomadura luzonensis]MCK2213740.1 hypothetical protein [Actinomadura luzonensis]